MRSLKSWYKMPLFIVLILMALGLLILIALGFLLVNECSYGGGMGAAYKQL